MKKLKNFFYGFRALFRKEVHVVLIERPRLEVNSIPQGILTNDWHATIKNKFLKIKEIISTGSYKSVSKDERFPIEFPVIGGEIKEKTNNRANAIINYSSADHNNRPLKSFFTYLNWGQIQRLKLMYRIHWVQKNENVKWLISRILGSGILVFILQKVWLWFFEC